MKNGSIKPWTEQDRSDLMLTIGEQSTKDGQFDITKHGNWLAGYEAFAARDLVDSQTLQIWFHTIQKLNLSEETPGLGDVVVQILGGTGDISNYMKITRSI
jgi:hypothetical protein